MDPSIAALLGAIIGGGFTLAGTWMMHFNAKADRKQTEEVEKHHRTQVLVDRFDNDEYMVRARCIVWKARHYILRFGSMLDFYNDSSYGKLLSGDHLVFYLQNFRYFWHTVAVTDVDWELCKKQIGRHYKNWYEEFFLPGSVGIPLDAPGGWDIANKEFEMLADKLIEEDALKKDSRKLPCTRRQRSAGNITAIRHNRREANPS